MKTVHSLRDVKLLIPVASAKPNDSMVKVYDSIFVHDDIYSEDYPSPEQVEEIIMTMIEDTYNQNLIYVKDLFEQIYHKRYKIGAKLGEICTKISKIMKETGKTIEEIVEEIRNYLGYNCSFNRLYQGRLIPCDSERIMNAYNLVKQNKSFLTIENTLYL